MAGFVTHTLRMTTDLESVNPEPGEDERVDALCAVLRRNGVGGAAPFTIEGEIQQMGHAAAGTRRSGWRKGAAWLIVTLVLATFALSTLALVDLILDRW